MKKSHFCLLFALLTLLVNTTAVSQDPPQLQTRELQITDRRLPEKTHNMEEIIKKENPFDAAEALREMAMELQLPLDAVPEMDEEVSHDIYFLHSNTRIQPQPGIDQTLQDVIENPGKIDNLTHDDGEVVCILQFNRRLSINELIEMLETNTRVLDEEIGMMSFMIKTHVDNLEQINSLPYVRGIHYYAPDYKISFAKQPREDGAARIYLFGSDLEYYEQVLSTYDIQVRTHFPSGNFLSVNLERGQYDVLAESHWWIRSIVEHETPNVDGFTDHDDTSKTLPSVQESNNRSDNEKSSGVSITVNSHPPSTGQTMYLWDFNDNNPKELSPNVSFTPGTTVRLMAIANIGFPYVFKKWELVTPQNLNIYNLGTNDGGLIEITIPDEDVELTAHFQVYNFQPDDSRKIVSAFNTNYSGENIDVGVFDNGIWLEGNGLVNPDLPAESVTIFENADNNEAHGTHVSGIIASRGNRVLSCEHNAKGVAPSADLFVGSFSSGIDDSYDFFASHDVYLSNHSWGFTGNYTYNSVAASFDDWSRDDNHIFVKSAGNNGNNITAPGTGKNVITVGSINHYTEDGNRLTSRKIGNRSNFSNHGPTLDGRLKPELVAPGGNGTRARGIVSTNIPNWEVTSNNNVINLSYTSIPMQGTIDDEYLYPEWPEDDFYMRMSGTSMAAPHVTGSIAQMTENFYSDGLDDFNSELIKALLINNTIPLKQNTSSSPLSGYASNTIGYGLLNNFSNLHYFAEEQEPILIGIEQISYSYLTGGGSHDWELEVEEGTVKITVTIAYNDRQGISSTGQNEPLKNRLDLSITSPSGVTESYTLPNGVTENSPIKKLVVEDPEAGEWIATVDFTSAYGILPSYSQTYAIVADAKYKTPELELTANNTSITVPAGGQFQINPEVSNTGGYIAAGVTLGVYEESLSEADWIFGGNANRTFYVGNLLNEGHSANKVLNIRAPEDPGTYTLIVEADGINMEFDTNEYPKTKEITIVVTDDEPDLEHLEIAFSLDRSGSMNWYGYMQDAKDVSNTFVDLMELGDYLAVTSFASSASVNYPFTELATQQDKDDAKAAINSIHASGGTGMGAGMLAAQQELNKGNTSQKQFMLLLGDGFENSYPYVDDVLPNIPYNTDIYTVALGPESDQTLLNNIAASTGGAYLYSPGTSDLAGSYQDMRTQVTGQQMLAIFGGEITEGETQSHTTPIDGGSQETQFLLTWPGSDMDLTLTDPDGHVIDHNTTDPDITFISGDAHEIYKVKSPIPGDYDIHVEGVSLSGSQNYDVFVTGRSELEMDVAFDKSLYGLNEPILITAGIMDGEIPVTGATVEAEVLLPAKSDFVPKGMYDDEEPLSGKPLVFDEETGNYYDEDGQLRYYKTTLILYDDGQHGDGQADNGVYGNYFTNTGTPGSYSFNVSASGMAPVSGQFTRLRRASTAVTTAQSILVTKPQTGAEWYNNNDHTVKWSSTNISGNVDIFLSVDSGNNFDIPLAEDVPDTGSLEVFIPDVASNTFSRIQVQSIDHPTVTGTNPGNFSILENPDTHDLAPCELTAEADGNSAVLTWKAPGTCEDDDDDNGDDPVQLSEGFEGSLFPPAEWAGLSPQGYVGWIKVGTGTSPVPGWNQGEAIAAPDGEDFMAFATWNTGGSGSTDQWLVTPQVTPEAETVLSFHMRYWPDTYDDQVDILISTTSQTDPAAFTTVIDNLEFTEGSSENWTHYTYQLSNYVAAGTPVYIAFREHVPDNQTMGAAIFLDNVYVGPADKADLMLADSQNQGMSHDNTASDSEIPAKKDSAHNPGLPNTAPVDTGGERGLITSGKNTYTITTHDHHAVRSDDDLPSPDFYRIHRNDTYVANVDGQTLTFTDQGLEEATYAYYITAVYDEPDGVIFSDPSNTAQVTITEGACTPGWEVVGNLEHNMSIVGELIIDGQVSTNENDMVGAFVDGECRGIASPIPEFGGLVFLSVGSNQSSGENVELKIWNSSTCHSCDAVPGFVFESQGELGTADDPYVMECGDDSDEVVQDIDFGEGFNWFSINVATGNMGVNSLLEPLNPCPDDRVIGQQNFALYTGAEWIGSLTELNNKEKFRMKLCSDQTLSITGTAAPLDPMNLNSGFTWISYLPQECIPVNDALDNLVPTPASDSRIIGQETFSLYTGNEWIGSLTHMCPGEGYIIRLSDQSTLTYPESAGKFSGDQPQAKTRKSPTGVYPRENLEHTMMVVATLDKGDPTQAVNPGDVIYAFAGEECRGMASPLPEHNGRIFMSVASDSEQHEQISFKVWLEDKDELVTVNEQIAFVSLQSTGTMDDPLVLTLDHPVDATDLASNGNFIGQAYPNPFTGHTNVPYRISEPADVQVRLYDSLGQLVRTVEENHEQAGEYLLRVERKGLRQGVYFMMIDISTHKESLHKNSKLIIQ